MTESKLNNLLIELKHTMKKYIVIYNLNISTEVINTLDGNKVTCDIIKLNDRIVTYEDTILILKNNRSPMNDIFSVSFSKI